MKIIDFKNKPDKTTPINRTNLNLLQKNVEEVFNGSEPMGSIVVEDITCKNIAVPNCTDNTRNGITKKYNEDTGIYKVIGTATADTYIGVSYPRILYANKTYTISCSENLPNGVSIYSDGNSNIGLVYGDTNITSGNNSKSFTPTKTGKISFSMLIRNGTTVDTDLMIQLEEGGVATNCVPYKEFTNKQVYSTREQIIGTWIDGRPIYRKIMNVNTMPNNTGLVVNHDISGIDNFISIKGIAISSNGANIPFPGGSTSGDIIITANKIAFTITTTSDRSMCSAYVILEYIKTTDDAISTLEATE